MPAENGITITLTTADTNYNLYTLLVAVDATLKPVASELLLQAGLANGDGQVRIGGSAISGSRAGVILLAGDVRVYDWRPQGVDMRQIYLRPSAAS